MELTPQLLTDEIDFRIAVRGYDRNEVDDFLERVAVAVGQLQTQLTRAVTRAKNAEARLAEIAEGGATDDGSTQGVPVEAPEAPREDASRAPSPQAPPAAPEAATEASSSNDEDLNGELRRTLVLAQRTADTAIREAHDQARTIVERANGEAEAAREAARVRLLTEISELETLRETMRDDTVTLERHLGSERARVRETIQVLRRLVDDPRSFEAGVLPELSEATTPPAEPEDPKPLELGSGGTRDHEPERRAESDITASEPEPTTDPSPSVAVGNEVEDAPEPAPEADLSAVHRDVEPDRVEEPETPSAAAEAAPVVGSGPIAYEEEAPAPGLAQRSGTASEGLGQLFDSAAGSGDWRSAGSERGDQGPHTQPVAAARFEEESDEAFLAELRRAMDDDEPLGPDDER